MVSKIDNKFMIDLKEQLVNKNKLAVGTADLYITKLKKLNNNVPFRSFSFLKDFKTIKEKLDSYENLNTRKSYISSIVATLNYADIKSYNGIQLYYKSLLMEAKNEFDEKPKNIKSEVQKENWVTWGYVRDVFCKLKEKVALNPTQRLYEDYMLLALYVCFPPRRSMDYFFMKISTDTTDDKFNYYNPDAGVFVMNVYKTVKTYGKEVLYINDTLKSILSDYIQYMGLKDGDFLLFNYSNRNSSSLVTKRLNAIFEKKISSSMLRHIFITSELGSKIEELKCVADIMGHSSTTQSSYVLN